MATSAPKQSPQSRADRVFRPKKALVIAETSEMLMYPTNLSFPELRPDVGSASHRSATLSAVFAFHFPHHPFAYHNIGIFLSSLRKVHDGDIVMAIPANSPDTFIDKHKAHDVVVYSLPLEKVSLKHNLVGIKFEEFPDETAMPMSIFRYYLYWYWAKQYSSDTWILVSDFRDVFFQADPFTYKEHVWKRPGSFVASLETYPDKVISRCPFNWGWIRECYGDDAVRFIERFTASCSGATMGSRNTMLIYVCSYYCTFSLAFMLSFSFLFRVFWSARALILNFVYNLLCSLFCLADHK